MSSYATGDRYAAVRRLGLVQRQAGVDPEIADLVVAYGRLLTDRGQLLDFYPTRFERGTPEHAWTERLGAANPGRDPRLVGFLAAYAGAMERRGLPPLFSVDHFCRQLEIGRDRVSGLCRNPDKWYRRFDIPKAAGGARPILAPMGQLRRLQQWIHRSLLRNCEIHPCAHAFVPGRSILTNSEPHVGRRVVVRLDLEDFFGSIRHRRVRRVFQGLGYPYRVAVVLASLCTRDGSLPQGAPTSPALSNLVAGRLDRRFAGLQKKLGCSYTRYADDLVFSSDNRKLPSLIPFFREIVRDEGFRLNERKTRIMRQGSRQEVTGIVVNRRPNLRRDHVRKLRAASHRAATRGPGSIKLRSSQPGARPIKVLEGHLAFLQMVYPERVAGLRRDLIAGKD